MKESQKPNLIEMGERSTSRAGEHFSLREIVNKKGGIDSSMRAELKLILEQNEFLSHVRVITISPEEEPYTGGRFHTVQIDEHSFVPAISIVFENKKHLEKILEVREIAARIVANKLGIDFDLMTPDLHRKFIIAHELGHAADYVKNYETNPEYQNGAAPSAWNMHYESNLLTLPVSGIDPASLNQKVLGYKDLAAFIKAHPDITATLDASSVKTLQDLLRVQEQAYRSSAYESYADDFATNFLKRNARELHI